jgi:murein DD-endopeptidase MepM/ murein hydrolase activator NlpD
MKKVFIVAILLFIILPKVIVSAEEGRGDVESLQELIEKRSDELRVIQEEREALEQELEEINKTQSALKRDIGKINLNVNRLDLSIRSSKIIVEKLGLEVEKLQSEIIGVGETMEDRKKTIGQLFQKIRERDKESFLVIFLRHPTLAGGVDEVQSIVNLNNDLAVSVGELKNFQKELVQKESYIKEKKKERESQKQNLQYQQDIASEERSSKQSFLAQTKVEEAEYARQIVQLDKEQGEISSVIEEIEHKLRSSFDSTLLPIKRMGVLGYPIKNPLITQITQKYGSTPFARTAYKSKTHTGIDFGIGIGTPLYASEDGVIRAVDNNDKGIARRNKYQYGKYILIDHNNNMTTLYAHMNRSIVSTGETVKRGQIIGYSGNTGYATGPHLHFGVYWTPSLQLKKIPPASGLVPIGITIDPQDYL